MNMDERVVLEQERQENKHLCRFDGYKKKSALVGFSEYIQDKKEESEW
jgi:hypothetical protein